MRESGGRSARSKVSGSPHRDTEQDGDTETRIHHEDAKAHEEGASMGDERREGGRDWLTRMVSAVLPSGPFE